MQSAAIKLQVPRRGLEESSNHMAHQERVREDYVCKTMGSKQANKQTDASSNNVTLTKWGNFGRLNLYAVRQF